MANASYLIYEDSGMTISKNSAGQIAFQGSSATEVIQNTTNALNSSGGIVVLEPGDYVISSPIYVTPSLNATLTGEGWNTVISVPPSFNNYLIDLEGSDWTMTNLLVNCTNQLNNGLAGIYVHGGHDVIEDVYVTQSSHGGISAYGLDDIIEYNSLIDNRGDGIIARGANQIIEYNLVSRTEENNGISFVGAENAIVLHNLVLGVADYGIGAEPRGIGGAVIGPPCANLTIAMNLILYPGKAGVTIYHLGATNTIITDNLILRPGSNGIAVLDMNSEIALKNNTIDASGTNGIMIVGGTAPDTQINVTGNRIYDLAAATDTAIQLLGNTSQLFLVSNFINGTEGTGIALLGNNTETTISLNHIQGLNFGVIEQPPGDYNTIIGNVFVSTKVTEIITGSHDILA